MTVWDIAHRWAGYDPDLYRLCHPLQVKDNFRLLMEAILNGHMSCMNLTLAKRPSDSKSDPKFYIRTHLDAINACIWGKRYSRKLLKWAEIERDDFQEWCEHLSIPLPEFWFPKGWKHHFEVPEGGTHAMWARHVEPREHGDFSIRFDLPDVGFEEPSGLDSAVSDDEQRNIRASRKVKICTQQIAQALWEEHPERTISEMTKDPILLRYSGAAHYASALPKWLSEIAPVNIKGKRGRPRNKPDTSLD